MIINRMYCPACCSYCVRAEMLFRQKGARNNRMLIDVLHGGFGEF
jgi:L-lysine 2,3-aminomutase